MVFTGGLLKNQEKLGRFAVALALVPFGLSFVEMLRSPVFLTILLMLVLVNYENMVRWRQQFLAADPIIKMSVMFGLIGFSFTIFLLWVGFEL